MKKCKYCGAELLEESNFCTECGKPISQSQCPHCGAPVNDDDTFCQECGKRINEPISLDAEPALGQCPQCGADVSEGDTFCQECGYNLVSGEENVVTTNYEDAGRDVVEETESSSKSKYIILVIVGIIALALIGGWYFLGSSNTTEGSKAAVVSDSDSIIVDSDSIVEDINDVHSEAYIKHRLQQICDGVPSTPEKTFVNKYFSESFKKLYNAVNEKYDNEYPESDMGYFGSYFWSNSGSVDDSNINSVTVLEVELITESTALATVQDYVKYGKNDELKNSKQIKLVFENDDWFIDDFNDYKSNMEEYINRTNDSETITAIGAFTDEINDDGNDSIR